MGNLPLRVRPNKRPGPDDDLAADIRAMVMRLQLVMVLTEVLKVSGLALLIELAW